MSKEMLAIPVYRVGDPKNNNRKKWRAEEEERRKRSLTPKNLIIFWISANWNSASKQSTSNVQSKF
jgi:hypothetical protein